MAERLSTAMRNWVLGGGSYREALDDCVMKIYSGTAPTSADALVTGTLLVTVSKSAGTVSTTERSTPARVSVTVLSAATGTYIATVTIDSTAYTVTYNGATDAEGFSDVNAVAKGLAREIRETVNQAYAIASGAGGVLYVQCKIAGLTMTIADGGGANSIGTVAVIEAGTRASSDSLYFGLPAAGSMSKSTDTWSGTVAATGVAGYFRLVRPDDDGTLVTTTQRRLQGNVSTSGAELNMSNTSLTISTTHTVDTYAITQPAEE